MPEHVLFVVGVFPPQIGGVERHAAQLADGLVAAGHRATVVTLTGEPGTAVEDGVDVVRLRGRGWIGGVVAFPPIGTRRLVTRLAKEVGATAVSSHTRFFPMSLIALRAARAAGLPLVHTEHGSAHVRGVSPVVALASRLVDWTIGRAVLRGADHVLAVSEAVQAFVRRLAGVDAELFYNAIDTAFWTPGHGSDAPDAQRLVFVGRIVPGKGWDDFIAAAAAIRSMPDAPAFTAHILGDGTMIEECRAAASASTAAEIIRVHGAVGSETVRDLLDGAILVNPTTLSEGFQTTLLEALACGASVVSYPVPGLEALRADDFPVTTVPRGDRAALAAAVDEALRRPRPAMQIDRLSAWGWPARVQQYLRAIAAARIGS